MNVTAPAAVVSAASLAAPVARCALLDTGRADDLPGRRWLLRPLWPLLGLAAAFPGILMWEFFLHSRGPAVLHTLA